MSMYFSIIVNCCITTYFMHLPSKINVHSFDPLVAVTVQISTFLNKTVLDDYYTMKLRGPVTRTEKKNVFILTINMQKSSPPLLVGDSTAAGDIYCLLSVLHKYHSC